MRVHRHGPYIRLVFVHRMEGTRLPEFLRIAPAKKKLLHVPRKSGGSTRVVAFHSARLHRRKIIDRIKFVHQGRAGPGPGHVHEHA